MTELPRTDTADFIRRWESSGAAKRANYQLFLSELCDLLGVPRPDSTRRAGERFFAPTDLSGL